MSARLQQDPGAPGALVKPVSEGTPQLVAQVSTTATALEHQTHPVIQTQVFSLHQDEKVTPPLVRPNPPNFGSNFVSKYHSAALVFNL